MEKIKIDISDLYKDSKVLTFLLSPAKSQRKKILSLLILFYSFPIISFALSLFNGTLFLPDKLLGMMEDYLYMAYILLVAPMLLLLLYNVMTRYKIFIEDSPSFCKAGTGEELKIIIEENIINIQKVKPVQRIIQLILGLIAVSSNTSSIINRQGGWDSLDYPVVFSFVAIHLLIVIGFVLPTIIIRFIDLVRFQIHLTRALVKRNMLSIKPLSPDGAGGLRSLGKLSLAYTYMLIPFLLTLGVQYLTWDYLTPGFYLGLFGFLPLSMFVFFFPLSVVHQAMDETKRNIMKKLSNKYDQLNNGLLEKMDDDGWENELINKNKTLEIIDNMYKVAEKMPVWPFNISILVRFLSFNVFPLIVFFIQMLVNADSIIYNLDKLKIFSGQN